MSSIQSMGMSRRQFVAASAAGAFALAGVAAGRAFAEETAAEGEAAEETAPEKTAAEAYVPAATEYPLTVTMWDGDGNEFTQTFEAAPATAITLNDSSAEVMCRLGLADRVIGTVDPEAAMPDEIAEAYEGIAKLGDKKTLSRETIVGMGPEVVISRAASFTAEDQTDAASYNDMGILMYSQVASAGKGNPTLQGIIDDVKNIAAIFDAQEAAADLVNDLQTRLVDIDARVAEAAADAGEPQKVLFMVNFKEGTFGTMGGKIGASLQFNVIEQMGAQMASTESASGLTFENLITMNPDLIIYITSTRNAETDATALDTLYAEEAIQSVPAVANGRIVEIPYAEFIDYSPRVFDSAEKILEALYPAQA